jgi:hypothetical protein
MVKLARQQLRGRTLSRIQEKGLAKVEAREHAYRLFRNRQRPQLVCAVAEHRPLPGFLGPEQWLFDRTLNRSDPAPSGFRERAAAVGMQLNGFYLFQQLRTGIKPACLFSNAMSRAA